jgi:putative transposase
MLGGPRSSFYAWRNQAETVTAARRRDLAARIERIFTDSRSTYGCRRIAAELNRDARPASVGLVADLMRELGLRACRPRADIRTTVPGDEPVGDQPGPARPGLHRARARAASGRRHHLPAHR